MSDRRPTDDVMARELIAARARIAELEHERDALRQLVRAAAVASEAAQRPPLGYAVAIRHGDSTPPEPEIIYWAKEGAQRDARFRASIRGDDWRVYEVREVQP